jgi:predicted membrane-bound dolichyl-phosphate-mannose-protein mannosyltransferase
MFDEKSYVPAAKSYLTRGGLLNAEHPPLGKWLIAAGISIFGNNAVGWRIPSVVFGIASIFIFYLICIQLCRKEANSDTIKLTGSSELPRTQSWFTMTTFVPLVATFLFAFENMSFVQANIAMLDVFYVTFMLAGFLFYLRGNYLFCGIVMGLSMLCKTMALLGIVVILLHWTITRRREIATDFQHILDPLKEKNCLLRHNTIRDMGKVLITVAVMWIILLPLLEYPASHQFVNPISRTLYMFRYAVNFNPSHGRASGIENKPWTWLTSPVYIVYSQKPLYLAATSWNIWVFIIPSILYLAYELIKYRKLKHKVATFALFWFLGVYLLLIPLSLITQRSMFVYYMYPVIPSVCLAIAWSGWKIWITMQKNKQRATIFQWILVSYLIGTIIVFFLMSPFGGNLVFHF